MNKTLLAMAATVLLAACGGGNKYTISGTIDDDAFDGKKVYLKQEPIHGGEMLDSVVVAGRSFTFEGTVDTPFIAMLQTENTDGNGMYIRCVVEPGHVVATITHEDSTDCVGGTPLNDRLQQSSRREAAIYSRIWNNPDDTLLARKNYIDSLSTVTYDSEGRHVKLPSGVTVEEYRRLQDYGNDLATKYIEELTAMKWEQYNENRDNVLGHYAMVHLSMHDYRLNEDMVFADSVAREAQPAVRNMLQAQINRMRNQEATSAGKPYIDLGGVVKTLENGQWKERDGSLKSLIDGKLALIDFWASWCGPCREEIKATLLAIDRKYRPQGLVVVGIDVDDQPEAHAKAVEKLGITYPQLLDTTPDTRSGESFTEQYGIYGIPEILLIAPDGTILERGIRGEEIEPAVLKALQQLKK